jgi:hypothetical protein
MRILEVMMVAGALVTLGCASAYDQAYEQETQRLEAQEQARRAEERAAAVARYLTSQGIQSSRLAVQGFASEFPAGSNESAQGRLNNRRVEVTVR